MPMVDIRRVDPLRSIPPNHRPCIRKPKNAVACSAVYQLAQRKSQRRRVAHRRCSPTGDPTTDSSKRSEVVLPDASGGIDRQQTRSAQPSGYQSAILSVAIRRHGSRACSENLQASPAGSRRCDLSRPAETRQVRARPPPCGELPENPVTARELSP